MSNEWSRLLFLGVVWGAAFLFIRVASPELGPVLVAESRVAIAGAILLAVGRLAVLRHVAARPGDFLVLAITYSAIPFTLVSFATLSITASTTSVLNATVPIFTALLAVLWLHQAISPRRAVGIGLGMLGVAIALGQGSVAPTPETLVAFGASLVAALSYAFAGLYARRRMGDVPPTSLAAGQLTVAAVLLAPFALATAPTTMPSAGALGAVLLLAVVSTAAAWPVFFGLLERCGATKASTITFIVPAFGLLWGALLLGEEIGAEVLVGFAAILASLLLVMGVGLPRRVARYLRPLGALAGG